MAQEAKRLEAEKKAAEAPRKTEASRAQSDEAVQGSIPVAPPPPSAKPQFVRSYSTTPLDSSASEEEVTEEKPVLERTVSEQRASDSYVAQHLLKRRASMMIEPDDLADDTDTDDTFFSHSAGLTSDSTSVAASVDTDADSTVSEECSEAKSSAESSVSDQEKAEKSRGIWAKLKNRAAKTGNKFLESIQSGTQLRKAQPDNQKQDGTPVAPTSKPDGNLLENALGKAISRFYLPEHEDDQKDVKTGPRTSLKKTQDDDGWDD